MFSSGNSESLRDYSAAVKVVSPVKQCLLLARQWIFPETINYMVKGQKRMGKEHTGAGKTHHLLNLLTPMGLVTVDLAVAAGGFAFLKGTVCQSFAGVSQQVCTFLTQVLAAVMLMPAVVADHGLDSGFFPLHAFWSAHKAF